MKNKFQYNSRYEERITHPVDAIKKIRYLKTLDLSRINDLELTNLINDSFNIIPFTSALLPAGSKLFRARINNNGNHFIYTNDLYAPPSSCIKEYGRANKPGERIFYCSSNLKLAAFEVLTNSQVYLNRSLEDIKISIGIWQTKMNLHVASIYDNPKLHTLRKDILDEYLINQEMLFNGNISFNAAVSNSLLLQFFAEEFTKCDTKSNCDYRISNFYISSLRQSNSCISDEFFSDKFDGLNYPSIAMKYKGDNQAIFIESADSKIELINAIEIKCMNLNFCNGDFDPFIINETKLISDGKIFW